MRAQRIICERMYMPPLHRRTLIRKFNKNEKFPNTEAVLNSAISLPIYPSLSGEKVEYVADVFMKLLEGLDRV